ncbi:hypothetical protein [Pectinatus brassicae]|uniref:Uncharacterized protein n=1 Tax=Pectinatus brassicae TaxID=862415 RepID=A0A840UQA4_9FIRM|nr:hypothetical protein [Pectinatus brassicae]MBB5336362.1 hypothetical protein [Pectinatus brassicae]
MAKVDNMMKEHITAAKKWLGKAETSLNNQNNIRGDIHLMLAEAELKRAKEKNKQSFILSVKQWGIILSLSICVFAAIAFFMPEKNNQDKSIATKPASVVSVNKARIEAADPAASQQAVAKIKNTLPIRQEARVVSAKDNNKIISKINKPAVSENELKTNPSIQSNVPSKEMQQLMRTAKKTLQE